MKSMMLKRGPASIAQLALLIAIVFAAPLLGAQTPPRFVGVITAISDDTLTVKTDSGKVYQVVVPATAAISRIAPGQRDLSAAAAIQINDLSIGDRVLVKLDPNGPAGTAQVAQIVAVKQTDVALKQEKERGDWRQRGVGGMVKSVDTASGVILLTTGAGTMAKTITVRTTKATMLKRYAPGSERFDAALPAPIDAILPGDQLRARGIKNEGGTELDAEEVISGTFRNISGTISSLDVAGSTLVVKDLATKKQVTIHITKESQIRRLPESMSQILAARLKGGTASRGPGNLPQNGAGGAQEHSRGTPGGSGQGNGNGQSAGQGGDLQQMLNRAPTIQPAELQKGEAVMLVSTVGASDVTAITLLVGVRPLLESPEASQNLLSNWSMGTSAGATEAIQ